MLPILADEDFNNHILRGVSRLLPKLELVRVQDIGLLSASDSQVLEVAATKRCILLTHDARTMPLEAYQRVRANLPMPGLFVCPQNVAIGTAIESIALLAECSDVGEWEGKVVYLPL